MPPKRPGSRSASSSATSSSSSGSSSSSSSGSSSSGSDSSSDSESSASQGSQRSKRSTGSSTGSSSNESPQKTGKKNEGGASTKRSGAVTRSRSASSASQSSTESDSSPKKSSKSKKSAKKDGGIPSANAAAPKAVPKKSATAKPITKATKKLSDNDSDSDFGDFSLPKLAAKAKQAKRAATEAAALASLSPASQSSPSTTSISKPIVQPSKLAAVTSSNVKSDVVTTKATVVTSTPTSSVVDKSKMKSIFSESSASDDSDVPSKETSVKDTATASSNKGRKKSAGSTKKRSPSPPKLSPQKKTPSPSKAPARRGRPLGSGSKRTTSLGAAAVASIAARATASAAKLQSKKKTPVKKSSSTASSASSDSKSSSSSSSSDSSSDEKEEPQKKKETPASKTKAKATPTSKAKVKEDKVKKQPLTAKTPILNSTDSEGGKVARPTTRKTRGANVRKSRHVTGKNVSDSDSDIENSTRVTMKPVVGTQNNLKKKLSVLFPPVRKEIPGLPPMEKRMCPMQGCDSSGHLGGQLDRHFLLESCPVFHNLTSKSCRDFRSDLLKRSAARKKALTLLATKSPLGSPSSDQKRNLAKIQEARSRFREEDIPITDDMPEECEPDLAGFTSEWDLQIFREAQADTSEVIEQHMRGLPDTRQTRYLEMGSFEMEVWYQSPYPDDFSTLPKIYICEFCLKYHRSATQLKRHAAKCVWNHPPGDEIYRKEPISVFEICGKRYKQYCQSLCLLAKFFLDHKTLYFDVEPFLFYVMTTADSAGCHIVGYFSKEKNSVLNYNVSCILTLPPYQRQGYGRLLIDFSYLLSRAEGKIGSPEKPLSDLGLITYRAYWKDVLLEYICNYPEKEISIKAFSEEMGINPNDIISTLQYMGMIKYWKGQHLILKREDLINEYLEKSRNRPKGREIYPSALKWKPYQPSAKERKQAEQIKKNQEKQKKR